MSSRCKRPKIFRVFISWTLIRGLPWTHCRAYSTSRPPTAFYNIWKLNLCSKTDISKTAWINAWWSVLMFVFTLQGETLIKLLKFWPFSWKFDLTQNEFEKLNYLELYILDLLSKTRIDIFAKFIEITLSIFTMCSDLLLKRIKLKFCQWRVIFHNCWVKLLKIVHGTLQDLRWNSLQK